VSWDPLFNVTVTHLVNQALKITYPLPGVKDPRVRFRPLNVSKAGLAAISVSKLLLMFLDMMNSSMVMSPFRRIPFPGVNDPRVRLRPLNVSKAGLAASSCSLTVSS
jgi:hypothetical protein